MVDFRKLRTSKSQPTPIEPTEIFRRLPKSASINDLYASQAQVLGEWFQRRDSQDLVIKLHTGGGKTLVGLLIAQSILNETHEPVMYLAPTRQLVSQVYSEAQKYGTSAIVYDRAQGLRKSFLSGASILICTYQTLFNGMTRFGLRGQSTFTRVAGIILDDAHVAFATVRDAFTLRIAKSGDPSVPHELIDPDGYAKLTNLFRNDFQDIGRIGTFDDVVGGSDGATVLKVPYWSWNDRISVVREHLRSHRDTYKFVWPFLRDALEYCHCLISRDAIVLTPVLPLVDLIPTYTGCPHRIFMSATISDETAVVSTFDAHEEAVAKPIQSRSLAGVSERMILSPELMQFRMEEVPGVVQSLAQRIALDPAHKAGTIILVPSKAATQQWAQVGTIADSSDKVSAAVSALQAGTSCGPFIFANRYDGIDLPDSTCRLLILAGLPRGLSEYDRYRASTFGSSSELNATLAQRIEQGMGRAARGSADYCVILLTGKDLVAWLGRTANREFLTTSTRAQLEIGLEVSRHIGTWDALADTVMQCLERNRDWVAYHAEALADLTETTKENTGRLRQAKIERDAFRLLRQGNFEKALSKLEALCERESDLDPATMAWLLQFAGRIAYFWGDSARSQQLQERAYALNQNVVRPRTEFAYVQLPRPSRQADAIVANISRYSPHRSFLVAFEESVTHLVPEASASQFEQAVAEFGALIGFVTQRPDHMYGKGPDILWLLDDHLGLIMEAKSRKNPTNPLTKEEHGQLLNASEWFKKAYSRYEGVRVSIHPGTGATSSTVPGDTRVLTLEHLGEMVSEARALFRTLCDAPVPEGELVQRCELLLEGSSLTPATILDRHLALFETAGR